ncbi:TlpA family protein disulfide reductase [Chitinophaga sp. Mgbs1]|uniref:TlpA family protein disulfide reductase n=1 Tax=Chitinophaga solisilvae TaxID=1233460 RepID=A0A3S1BET0_9BACT|nr:TlpA family protein disulfide reductase [Chitinophaga solisilvae]
MKSITITIILAGLISCTEPDRKPEKTGKDGSSIPSFTLLLTDSLTIKDVASEKQGKPVVLFFFGAQCPYSHAEMETIIKNEARLRDVHFYIFTTPPFQLMKAFYDHFKLYEYPNMTVGLDQSSFFIKHFNVSGVPYTAIYGRDGKLKDAYLGKIGIKDILRGIEK